MPWKSQEFQLKPADRRQLNGMLGKGSVEPVRVTKRVQILLGLDDGISPRELSDLFRTDKRTIERLRTRYNEKGVEYAIFDQWRSVTEKLLSERQEAEIIAMVCGPQPGGRARWTYELIAEEAVARGMCGQVGRTTIRLLLQSHGIKPWREKNVVHFESHHRVHRENGRRTRHIREASRPH